MLYRRPTEWFSLRISSQALLCLLWFGVSAIVFGAAPAAAQEVAGPGLEERSETSGSESSDQAAPDAQGQRTRLLDEFEIADDDVDDPDALDRIAGEAAQRAAQASESRAQATQLLRELGQITALLESQVTSDEMPPEAQRVILRKLISKRLDEAQRAGEVDAYEAILSFESELEILARDRSEALRLEAQESEGTSQLRLDEAEEAHQDALRRVADAIRLEQEERNEEIRELLTRERELAEELAELTRREEEQVRALDAQRRQRIEDFAEARSRINAKIAEFPPYPRESTVAEKVDPLFEEVVSTRRRTRRQLYEHLSDRQEVEEAVSEYREAHRGALAQLENFGDVREENELIRHRYAIAQLRSNLTDRQLRMAKDVLDAHNEKYAILREEAQFYHGVVEELVPLISGDKRSEFFSLRREENWHDAVDGIREAGHRIQLTLEERVEAVTTLPGRLLSVAVLLWLFGFMWRCLLFPVAFFVGREYSSRLVRIFTDTLLRSRFFRRRAALAIKIGEILGAMIKPALLFIVTIIVVEYAAIGWGELYLLRWVINAAFIYWMVMIAVKTLVLPRGYREGSATKSDYKGFGVHEDAGDIEDLIEMELSRATKIVVSTRVVLIFWLLAFYVPALVLDATGYNVVWRIVDRLAVWGLLAVVYVVLSTWRDDIARIFARLASDRMPRATTIVEEHKERPWGVLLIGLASVYVTGREVARIARSHFVGTEWNRRITNFIFRKTIELQQRDRDNGEGDSEYEVPDEYKAWFKDQPLVDESYAMERMHLIERVEKSYNEWCQRPRKGAVAVVAEQGLGKTTLLNQLFGRWSTSEDYEVSFIQLNDKINDCSQVFEFLGSFLGLESAPEDLHEFVEAMLELPPRVLIIDDCHHFFLRRIGGFEAVELFLKIVSHTDHHHFWLLSFNGYTWTYLNRVHHRGHFFSDVIEMQPWTEAEIQEVIRNRDEMIDLPISFTELVVAHDDDEEQHYEIVRTSNGYFRVLHEFSRGNPRVALTFWLRSLRLDSESTLQVELFRRPSLDTLKSLRDDYIFALSAIAQHESLRPDEMATIIHAYPGDCEMIVEYLHDSDIIEFDPVFRRARIRGLFLRSVIKMLQDTNVLYT